MALAVDTIIGNPTVLGLSDGANVQQQLQNNYAFDYLHLRFTGLLTLASYTAAPSKLVESLENYFQSIQLQATGNTATATSDQLCNVDGPYLAFLTRMMEGTAPTRTDVSTSNGAYSFEANFKRYFNDPRSNASSLTRLFTNLCSSLMLTLQCRTSAAMVTGGTGGTAVVSAAQMTVMARQYLGLTPPTPSPFLKETQRTVNITGQANGYVVDRVPRGNVIRRQVFKGMVGANNFSDPSDAIFAATGKPEGAHVGLKLNNTVSVLDGVYPQMRADNKTLFGVEAIPTGYVIYEPARNKKLSASLPMGGVMQADNLVDVGYTGSSTNTLQITTQEIVKLSTAQFSAVR